MDDRRPIIAGERTRAQRIGRRRLVITLWLAVLALGLTALALRLLNPPLEEAVWGFRGFQGYYGLLVATLGAVIATRRPENLIGWVLIVAGYGSTLQEVAQEYFLYGHHVRDGALPGLALAGWLSNWLWVLGEYLLLVVLLLFPNGRPLTPRWRAALWLGGGLILLTVVVSAFAPGPLINAIGLNPLGVAWLPAHDSPLWSLAVFGSLILLALLVSLALALRFRRGDRVQRQQLKWIIFSGLSLPAASFFGAEPGLGADIVLAVCAGIVPAAVTVAILRYRLYDIDVIIRRTLLYSVLSLVLAGVYFGTVVLLQRIVEGLTGGQSPLVIVLSTLLIAALFAPLRRRLQRMIDRRFYRRQYDAQRVLATFARSARDETNLTQLSDALVHVVDDTLRPAHVGLWLRPSLGRSSDRKARR